MINGNVQERNGILHTVINYTDENGKRKQKWQTTGLVGVFGRICLLVIMSVFFIVTGNLTA